MNGNGYGDGTISNIQQGISNNQVNGNDNGYGDGSISNIQQGISNNQVNGNDNGYGDGSISNIQQGISNNQVNGNDNGYGDGTTSNTTSRSDASLRSAGSQQETPNFQVTATTNGLTTNARKPEP